MKREVQMFRQLAIAVATAALAGIVAPALAAGSAPADLIVTATVAQRCAISTSAVAFGAYDPVSTHSAAGIDLNGTGAVSVTCTKNSTGVTVTLGLGSNALGSVRRMLGTSSDHLTYELYHASATTPAAVCSFPGTTVWGTAGAGIFTPTGVSGWGANSAKSFNVCGTIPKAQDASADSYTDTVVATVNF
jgi:spore coat protein U-like protein